MKVQFTRTPPEEYSAYVEGESVDLPEQQARYLIGLGVAAQPRGVSGDTVMASSRTEIVGADNETQVVIQGRGANIVTIASPENDKLFPGTGSGASAEVSHEERLAADREHATSLVKQEAGRTGGFNDETVPDKRAKKLSGKVDNDASLDHESAASDAEKDAEPKKAGTAAKKAASSAPETK